MPRFPEPGEASAARRRVPESYLRAEISTFPLASERSFRLGLVKLDPRLAEGSPTQRLWRSCEEEFAPHTGWSLDRLVTARDRGWFGPGPSPGLRAIPLHEYLRVLARSQLEPRAGVTMVRTNPELPQLEAASQYRWMTLSIPEDLILAALGVEPVPMRVDLEPPLLVRRLFDLGMAEVHQHIGAGMSFPLLWVSALAALASDRVSEGDLISPGAPLCDGRETLRWLLSAAVLRCILAEFLIEGSRAQFHDFAQRLHYHRGGPLATTRSRETLSAIMAALIRADESKLPDFDALRSLYAELHPAAGTLAGSPLRNVADAYARCDPIAARLSLNGENAGERWFMRKGLAYLANRPNLPGTDSDLLFERLFWQVVRVRCQYYRTIAERPLTGGLQWFMRFYNRISSLRQPLEPILPQVSYDVAGGSERIRALEVRQSADDTAVQVGEQLLKLLRSWKAVLEERSSSMFEPEIGVIYHFIKLRDPNKAWHRGTPSAYWTGTFAEPNHRDGCIGVDPGRYVAYFADQWRKARAVAELIREVPAVLWMVRGVDVTSDEIAVPTWVLVPLFRHVVDVSARESIRTAEDAGPPLRITAHVGEDFRHLLEGLRRIYEQIHYIFAGATGRLGHAIALGLEPRAWAESVGSVLMPAEERLWDLVWEWRLYTRHKIRAEYVAQAPRGRVEELLTQVRELSGHIHGGRANGARGYGVQELADAHHLLHGLLVPPVAHPDFDDGYDNFVRVAHEVSQDGRRGARCSPKVGQLLKAYLSDNNTFLRGQTLIDVPAHPEVEAITAVQDALRRGVARTGVVVEVNPSSNLLVGDMLDLRNHPILRLFPPIPEEGAPPPVPIALGSDDPVTFSTRLLQEYTLLYQTACAAGYPERVVQVWLESIRSTGMDARFTTIWNPSALDKTEALIERLSEHLHLPGEFAPRRQHGRAKR